MVINKVEGSKVQYEWLEIGDEITFSAKEGAFISRVGCNGSDGGECISGGDSFESLKVKVHSVLRKKKRSCFWDVLDMETGQYLRMLERQLEVDEIAKVQSLESVCLEDWERKLLGIPAIRVHIKNRVLSIYPVLGEDLESWRSRECQPKLEDIYEKMSLLVDVVRQLHKSGKMLLGVLPCEVIFTEDSVFFEGRESFCPVGDSRVCEERLLGYSSGILFESNDIEIDPIVDIYTLGALLYYMIAGIDPPVCEESYYMPVLSVRECNPRFAFGLESVLSRSLCYDPQMCYQSVGEFWDDFEKSIDLMRAYEEVSPELLYGIAEVDRHIGISKKYRCSVNQDDVYCASHPSQRRCFIAISDGVSTASYGSGDIASGFLVSEAKKAWESLRGEAIDDVYGFMSSILEKTNVRICEYLEREYVGLSFSFVDTMGATAVLAYFDGYHLYVGSVGDSACFLLREGNFIRLTREHNFFTMSVLQGLRVEECLRLSSGGALTQCLGLLEVDSKGKVVPLKVHFDFIKLAVYAEDRILLTSDGLLEYADEDWNNGLLKIASILDEENDPRLACLSLIMCANRGGGGDNIGVGVLHINSHVNEVFGYQESHEANRMIEVSYIRSKSDKLLIIEVDSIFEAKRGLSIDEWDFYSICQKFLWTEHSTVALVSKYHSDSEIEALLLEYGIDPFLGIKAWGMSVEEFINEFGVFNKFNQVLYGHLSDGKFRID